MWQKASLVMPFVINYRYKQGSHASRPCVTSAALVRRFALDGHEIALAYVQFLSSPCAHSAPRCCALRMAHPCTGRARTPTVTALPRHLPQRGRQVIITRASKIAFCARAPHLRIPALLRKGEIARAKMLLSARYRGKTRTKCKRLRGFPKTHGISFCQFKKKFVNRILRRIFIWVTYVRA